MKSLKVMAALLVAAAMTSCSAVKPTRCNIKHSRYKVR